MQKTKVAINGFGRIGRAFFKLAFDAPEIEIVAINDLGDVANLAYLLKYDSAYGHYDKKITFEEGFLIVEGKKINFVQEKEPTKLPWAKIGVDVVVESTGFFTNYKDAKVHLDAGAKRVVITAPAKPSSAKATNGQGEISMEGIETGTVLMGINEEKLSTCQITSNASCTTNASSPVIQIMNETIGIEKAILSTVHAMTGTQRVVDSPNPKDFREGRAASHNIIPTSTGAAIAVTQAITELGGKFDGISLRVPVITGSIADITFIAKRSTTKEEVNEIFTKASKDKRWSKILAVSDEQLVSSDIIGRLHASIIDLEMTRVVDGNLVKVLAWYDNEMGYTHILVQHVIKTGQFIKRD